jgi:hypothetical protein
MANDEITHAVANSDHLLYRGTLGLPKANNKKREELRTYMTIDTPSVLFMHLLSFSIRKRKELRWFRCQAILRIDEAMATGRNNDDVMRRAGERGSQPTHHQTHARSSGQQASSGSRWERRATSLLPHGSTGPPQRGERPRSPCQGPGCSWAGPARQARCGPRGARGIR